MGNETASRTGLLRRLGPAVACGALGLALLTGCAAGQHAQTVEQTPAIDGVQAQAGTIAIRAAGIAAPESGTSYAKGSDAELRMVLVNQGSQADKLVSVSSPAATGAELGAGSGSSGPGSAALSASPAASDSSSPTASSSASASSSDSASASDPASASPSGSAAGNPLDLPPQQSVQIGISDGDATAMLTGLNAELFTAQPIPVTLTFASGTSVTVTMAVQLTSEAPPAPTVSVATQQAGE